MKKAVPLASLLALALLNQPVLAQAINKNAFDFQLTDGIRAFPAIEISTRYDDNIFLQDKTGVKSSWITELAPSLMLGTKAGASFYSAKYTLKAGFYHSSKDDDYRDQLLNLNSHTEFNHRNKLDVTFDYQKEHENRGSGISDGTGSVSKTPHEYRDVILSGAYTYGADTAKGRIRLNASRLDKKYTNHRDYTRVFDRNDDELGATFFYRIMPRTFLLFEAKYKDINYDNTPLSVPKLDGDETSYQFGITWEATAKTSGSAKLGKLYKNFDDSQYKDDVFSSWELGIEWKPLSYSRFKIRSSSRPQETTGSSTYIKSQELELSWHHSWSDRVKSKIRTRFSNDEYMGSKREDDKVHYLAGLEYQFRRGVAFGVDYTHKTRDSNQNGSDYSNNIFMLTAKIGI